MRETKTGAEEHTVHRNINIKHISGTSVYNIHTIQIEGRASIRDWGRVLKKEAAVIKSRYKTWQSVFTKDPFTLV